MEKQTVTLDDLKIKLAQVSRVTAANVSVNRLRLYGAAAGALALTIGVSYLIGKRRGRRSARSR